MSKLEELTQKANEILDEYRNRLKIPPLKVPESELKLYLNPSSEYLEELSLDQCFQHALVLTRYKVYVDSQISLEKARHLLFTKYLNHFFSSKWQDFDKHIPREIKEGMILKENEDLSIIWKATNHIEAKILGFEKFADSIRTYIYLYENYGKSKQWRK